MNHTKPDIQKLDITYKHVEIQTNHLRSLYIEMRTEGIVPLSSILETNITEHFWAGIIGSLNNNELVNISIRGKTGSSKSTIGCKILYVLIQEMIRQKKINIESNEKLQKYLYSRICSDQTEFLRFAMKEKGNTVALIDEFSTLGETGFNATTEQALYKEHSDLFAQENIHKISCSPSHINDKNADIILDFMGLDREEEVSQFKVSYRDATEYMPYPLGIVNIYVGDIMKMDFYKWYRAKKFKRLDLLKKHGVRNVRELEFSMIIKKTYTELKDLAKYKKVGNGAIVGMADQIRRENNLQYSILTLNFVALKIQGMLDLVTEMQQLQRKIDKTINGVEKSILEENKNKFGNIIQRRVEEEENNIKIEEEYRRIQ